jgi:hypothetical protein
MSKSLPNKRRIANRKRRKVTLPRTADDFFAQPEQLQTDWQQTLRVISKMRADGISLRKAAKREGANPRTVSRLAGRALKRRSNGSYAATKSDSLLRVLQVITPDGMREVATKSSRDASTLGQYWDAVNKYVRTGDDSRLKKFEGKQISSSSGQKIRLITDRTELNRLGSAGVLSFESLYSRSV